MTADDYNKCMEAAANTDPVTFAHIEDGKQFLAQAMNLIDAAEAHIKAAFDLNPEWDDMLEQSVLEGKANFGACLASLCTWWSDLYNVDGTKK